MKPWTHTASSEECVTRLCVCVCQTLFQPQKGVYEQLSRECVLQGCCVDLFLFPSQFSDLATLAHLPVHTGGSVHTYSNFQVGQEAASAASSRSFQQRPGVPRSWTWTASTS